MATAVAVQYAKALAGLVQEDARYDAERIAGQLKTFESALAGSTELRNVLANPAVAPARKRAVVERLTGAAEITPVFRLDRVPPTPVTAGTALIEGLLKR